MIVLKFTFFEWRKIELGKVNCEGDVVADLNVTTDCGEERDCGESDRPAFAANQMFCTDVR
jgi:hypothetical protein